MPGPASPGSVLSAPSSTLPLPYLYSLSLLPYLFLPPSWKPGHPFLDGSQERYHALLRLAVRYCSFFFDVLAGLGDALRACSSPVVAVPDSLNLPVILFGCSPFAFRPSFLLATHSLSPLSSAVPRV